MSLFYDDQYNRVFRLVLNSRSSSNKFYSAMIIDDAKIHNGFHTKIYWQPKILNMNVFSFCKQNFRVCHKISTYFLQQRNGAILHNIIVHVCYKWEQTKESISSKTSTKK